MDYENHIRHQLNYLYADQGEQIWLELSNLIDDFQDRNPDHPSEEFQLTEKDAILITYGDQFQESNRSNLQSLDTFLTQYLGDAVNRVHILPFYPYSSDDGFSVIDYQTVNPEIGTWADISELSKSYQLMFDAVINHISRKSVWFQAFQKGDLPYNDFFIEVDPSTDLSSVFRPRALPLLTPVETSEGKKYVWTTFSEDQIDLNFSNPRVLLEIIKLLLFYIEQGARLIRLDAVGYIWKLIGTSSLNIPQAHSIVKIIRGVLNIAAPYTGIITETNVPHDENIKYFGEPVSGQETSGKPRSGDEAQMVYQFSLAPLVLHTIHCGDVTALNQWVNSLSVPYQDTAFFNFIASHDGIGVMPAKDLLTDDQIQELIDQTLQHGGKISYKTNSDGTKSVYELNITLYDALNNPALENPPIDIKRFLASQVIMLSLAGVPGIYIHSLFGSRNCHSCREQTGRARSLNREKFELDEMLSGLEDRENIHSKIFNEYTRMLLIRKNQPAFHPAGEQKILNIHRHVFMLLRSDINYRTHIICLVNASSQKQHIEINLREFGLERVDSYHDLISDQSIPSNNGQINLRLHGYQVMWLLSPYLASK